MIFFLLSIQFHQTYSACNDTKLFRFQLLHIKLVLPLLYFKLEKCLKLLSSLGISVQINRLESLFISECISLILVHKIQTVNSAETSKQVSHIEDQLRAKSIDNSLLTFLHFQTNLQFCKFTNTFLSLCQIFQRLMRCFCQDLPKKSR